MKKMDLNMTIGDSVTLIPALSGTYMKFGIDFCCGGDRSIEEALRDSKTEREIIIQAIKDKLASLEQTGETTVKLQELSNEEFVENIINTHHAFLRKILPELGISLFKLIEVHGQNHPELFEVHHLVGLLRTDLEEHLIKEEKELFPRMVANKTQEAKEWIDLLEKEHDVAGDVLKRLTVITDHFKLPEDACNTYRVTYQKLQQLQEDMYQHVHKENNILFKRFE
jgi:regulator of cell morphogenesis and NO signaling